MRSAEEHSASTSPPRFACEDGVPLVVPEVNGERAAEHSGIVANPNCCSIPLSMVLAPLRRCCGAARGARGHVSVGCGRRLAGDAAACSEAVEEHDLRMDWEFDGVEFDEESKMRAETRKILELPDLPVSATCVRVPVMVGHAEAVWVETVEPARPASRGAAARRGARAFSLEQIPDAGSAHRHRRGLVGRIRRDPTAENGLVLFLACDNLRKGAALNAMQIAELLIGATLPAYLGHRA